MLTTPLDNETRDKTQAELLVLILVRLDRLRADVGRYISHSHHLQGAMRGEHRTLGYNIGLDLAAIGTLHQFLHEINGPADNFIAMDGKDEDIIQAAMLHQHAPSLILKRKKRKG